MLLAKRIRTIREAYNLSQSEVAFKAGISPSAYGQIERRAAKSTYETLCKIAEAIGVTTPFLIDVKNNEVIERRIEKFIV